MINARSCVDSWYIQLIMNNPLENAIAHIIELGKSSKNNDTVNSGILLARRLNDLRGRGDRTLPAYPKDLARSTYRAIRDSVVSLGDEILRRDWRLWPVDDAHVVGLRADLAQLRERGHGRVASTRGAE